MAAAQNKNSSYCLLCLRSDKLRTLRSSKCMDRLVGMLNLAMSTTWKRRHKDNKSFCFVCEALLSRTLQVLDLLKYSMKADGVTDQSNNVQSEHPPVHKMTSLVITEILSVTCEPQETLDAEELVCSVVEEGGAGRGGARGGSGSLHEMSDVVIIDGDETYIIDDDDDEDPLINVRISEEVTVPSPDLHEKQNFVNISKTPSLETSNRHNTPPTIDNANRHVNDPLYLSKPNQANTLHPIMPTDLPHFINATNTSTPQLFHLPSQFPVHPSNINMGSNADRINLLSPITPQMCLNMPMNSNKKMVAVETSDNKFFLHEVIEGGDGVLYAPTVPGRIVNGQLEHLETIKFVNNSIVVETKSQTTKEVDDTHRKQLSMVNLNNTINNLSPDRMNNKRAKIGASVSCDFEITPSLGVGVNLKQNVLSAPCCDGIPKQNCVSNRTGKRSIAANSLAPRMKDDNIDWEDKIPMDVITYMDATDPSNPLNVEKPQTQLGVISAVYSETAASQGSLQQVLNDVNSTMEELLSKKNGVDTVISID